MTRIVEIVKQLRQGSLNNDDYRWKAADEIEQNRIDLEEYRRDVERLRAALEPFRALCVAVDEQAAKHKQPDDTIIHPGLTVGHFRQARAALEGKHE